MQEQTTAAAPTAKSRVSTGFDWLMALLGMWFIDGVFIDGWAHNHLDSSLETFFTPWHAALYSGFTVCALALLIRAIMGRAKGRSWFSIASWREALPPGYFPSLVGAGVFAFGGGFDLIWHTLFGIEANLEALLSPAHLFLSAGGFLMMSGPFRSAWYRKESPKSFVDALPLLFSMVCMLSVIAFMTQFAHLGRHFATGVNPGEELADHLQSRSAAGMLLQMAFMSGLVLLAARRWGKRLPFGFFTVLLGINAVGMSLLVHNTYEFRLIPAAMFAGLAADFLLRTIDPSPERPLAWRVFGTLVPFIYVGGFFKLLLLTEPVWWSIHMWLGTVFVCGVIGLLMSYMVVPPKMPARE